MRQQPIDRQRKAGALKLAEEHGSAEASRRTGVSADTIRYWRHKAAKAARPTDADVDDVERLDGLRGICGRRRRRRLPGLARRLLRAGAPRRRTWR